MFEITEILVEYRKNAMGLDVPVPGFSWKLKADGRDVMQTAFRIAVGCNAGETWDSGRVESSRSINVEYEGIDLEKMTLCNAEIASWDNRGNMAASETTFDFKADVEIPVNCTAKFRFPGSGKTVAVGYGKHHFSDKEPAAR